MKLKTAFIGLAGVLVIPCSIAVNEVEKDIGGVKNAVDKLDEKTTQVESALKEKEKTPAIKNLPGLGKFKLDTYEEPKRP